MKKIPFPIIILVIVGLFIAVASYVHYKNNGSLATTTYKDKHGWSITYDPLVMRVKEGTSGNTTFFNTIDDENKCIPLLRVTFIGNNYKHLKLKEYFDTNKGYGRAYENATFTKINGYEAFYLQGGIEEYNAGPNNFVINTEDKIFWLQYQAYPSSWVTENKTRKNACIEFAEYIRNVIKTFQYTRIS